MNDYCIRTTAADYPELLQIGAALGAITVDEDGIVSAVDGAWDYIGTIYEPTGTFTTYEGVEVPDTAPILAPDNTEYIHINLRTPLSLKVVAMELAEAHPEVAAGLANLGKYFMVDGEGNATTPATPARVWF